MIYNQPGDQPSNPNAPYVDGNPAAGIQGSIVPAAGVEFDQREVVEVITRANVRGYFDFTSTPCAIPSNADLTQLRKAIEGFITNWQWIISTNITKTVHGPGADFTDLIAAFAWLSQYRITNTGFVTFQLAGSTSGIAQQFVYNTTLTIYHPNIDRIKIVGAPLIGAPPQGIDFQYTGNRAVDAAGQLTMLRSRFGTELRFTNGAAIQVNGSLGLVGGAGLDSLLMTADGSGTNTGISFNNAYLSVHNCSFHGFSGDGFVLNNCYVWTIGDFVSSSGNAGNGFEFQGCLAMAATQTISCSNGGQGFIMQPATCIRQGGAGGVYSQGNAGAGVYGMNGSSANFANSHLLHNSTYGVYCDGSQIGCGSSTFTGNTTNAVYAANNGVVRTSGSTGVSGACNPALNVAGNNGAWITG